MCSLLVLYHSLKAIIAKLKRILNSLSLLHLKDCAKLLLPSFQAECNDSSGENSPPRQFPEMFFTSIFHSEISFKPNFLPWQGTISNTKIALYCLKMNINSQKVGLYLKTLPHYRYQCPIQTICSSAAPCFL